MSLINQLSDEKEPFATCLLSTDCTTTSGIEHRVLEDNGHSDILLRYMEDALQRHHISPEALQRHMDLIATLKIENLPILRSPYPQTSTTQKGNFAEVFLAEYLVSTTDMELPIYMYSSGDAAEQVVRMSLEGAEFALKISGSAAKNLAAALYTVLKDQKKTKCSTSSV